MPFLRVFDTEVLEIHISYWEKLMQIDMEAINLKLLKKETIVTDKKTRWNSRFSVEEQGTYGPVWSVRYNDITEIYVLYFLSWFSPNEFTRTQTSFLLTLRVAAHL